MNGFAHMLSQGGPLMYAVLLLALMVPITALAMGVVQAYRVWVPAVVWLLMPAVLVVAGAGGWLHGQVQTIQAIAAASAEMKDALLSAGLGISLIPAWFALYLASFMLALSALCGGVGAAIGAGHPARGRDVEWSIGPAAGAAVLVLLAACTGGGVGGVFGEPRVLALAGPVLLGGIGLIAVAARRPLEAIDRRRIAALRLQVGGMLVLSIGAFGAGAALHGMSALHEALGYAAPETVSMLLGEHAGGRSLGRIGGWAALAAAVPAALATLVAVLPMVRSLATVRSLIGGLLVMVLVGGVAVLPAIATWQRVQIVNTTNRARAGRAVGVAGDTPVVPAATAPVGWFDGVVTREGDTWLLRDERRDSRYLWHAGSMAPQSAAVAAQAGTSARALVEPRLVGQPEVRRIELLVRSHEEAAVRGDPYLVGWQLASVPFQLYAEGETTEEDTGYDHGWWEETRAATTWSARDALFVIDGGGVDGAGAWGVEPGDEAVIALHAAAPSASWPAVSDVGELLAARVAETGASHVVFVPGARWTVTDVAALCAAAGGARASDPYGWGEGATVAPGCALAAALPPRPSAMGLGEPPEDFDEASVQSLLELLSAGGGMDGGVVGGVVGWVDDDAVGMDDVNADGGAATVMGSLSRDEIRDVIRRHAGQLKYCYDQELTTSPALSGKVTVKFVIASDGTVSSAEARDSTVSASLEECVLRNFTRLQFPAPTGGGIVIVSYPVVFQPAG